MQKIQQKKNIFKLLMINKKDWIFAQPSEFYHLQLNSKKICLNEAQNILLKVVVFY